MWTGIDAIFFGKYKSSKPLDLPVAALAKAEFYRKVSGLKSGIA